MIYKSKLILIITITFLISNCRIISPEIGYKMLKSDKFYFPLNNDSSSKNIDDKLDTFRNQWYSKHLYSMDALILFDKTDKNLKIFRYTNLGTWSNPFSYQIELNDTSVIITYKLTNGLGGYKAGILIKNKQRILKRQDWESLINKIDSTDFWKIQTNDTHMILDGSEWIFEGLIGNRYHFVRRNSPDEYGGKDYASLCMFIEELYSKNK